MNLSKFYRADVDGLRGLAIFLVVAYHAFPDFVKAGFIGVDVFFVISGYLITRIIIDDLQAQEFSLSSFYARRVRRIFPSLIIVLVACVSFGWFVFWPVDFALLGKHIFASSFFYLNFNLMAELNYFDQDALKRPLINLWSLAVEEQFYILWPVFVMLLIRRKVLLVGCVILLLLSFGYGILNINDSRMFYSPFARFWELLAGCALALAMRHGAMIERHAHAFIQVSSWLGVFLLLWALIVVNHHVQYPGWYTLLPVGAAVLLIASGSQGHFNKYILSSRPLIWLGLISYPMYLWHWPLLTFARLQMPGQALSPGLLCAILAASAALSWLCYQYVEKPIRAQRDSLSIPLLLCGCLLFLGALGFVLHQHKGFEKRVPEELRGIAGAIDFQWANVNFKDYGRCYLAGQVDTQRFGECIDTRRPNVFLWGDSHAISIYPGLKYLQSYEHFGFSALTQSGCPPLFNIQDLLYRTNCNEINADVFRQVAELKPDVLILHASWEHLGLHPMTRDELLVKLEKTVQEIRGHIPQTQIIILGPTPRWIPDLPKALLEQAKKSTLMDVPERMVAAPAEKIDELDERMARTAENLGVVYISLYKKLCTKQGCLTKVGPAATDLTFVDYGHLSKAGAIYLGRQLQNELHPYFANKRYQTLKKEP